MMINRWTYVKHVAMPEAKPVIIGRTISRSAYVCGRYRRAIGPYSSIRVVLTSEPVDFSQMISRSHPGRSI